MRRAPLPWGVLFAGLLLWTGCTDITDPEKPVPGMDLGPAPLSDLAVEGRRIFRKARCVSCHIRGGPAPQAFIGSAPPPGGRRIGPLLADVGGRYTDRWHLLHLEDPRALRQQSTMPAYPWLFPGGEPGDDARALVAYLQAQRDPSVSRDPEARAVEALALRGEEAGPEAGAHTGDETPPGEVARAAAGARVFTRSCRGCHGPVGLGNGPAAEALDPQPANFTRATWTLVPHDAEGRPELETITRVVARGIPRGDMPPHEVLTPQDLLAVSEHVRRLAPVGAPGTPLPTGEAGSPELGASLYKALGCASCHGEDLKGGKGEVRYPLLGAPLKLEVPGALARTIWRGRPGAEMPAYETAIRGLDIETLGPMAAEDPSLGPLLHALPTLDPGDRLATLTAWLEGQLAPPR